MGRCYACCQENCGYGPCFCDCHQRGESMIIGNQWTIGDRYFYQAGPLPEEREQARRKAETEKPKALCATHPRYEAKRRPTSTCASCWKAWQLKLANKSWDDMTTRERILERFNTAERKVFTAAQVAKYAGKKLSTVSSEIHSLFKEGLILRVDGFGERGGYGYVMNPNREDECLRLLGKIPFDVKVYNK